MRFSWPAWPVRPAPRSLRFAFGLALLLTSSLPGTSGCGRRSGVPAEARRDFGDSSAPSPGDADTQVYLAMARAVAAKAGRAAAPAPPHGPGRRVVLAVWQDGEASVATAIGPTLEDSVASAAQSIPTSPTKEARFELDVPTRVETMNLDADVDVPLASMGLEGVLVTRDDGKTGFVLPGEIVQRGLFHARKLDRAGIARLLATRAGVPESDLAAMRAYRFRADVHVESPHHDSVLSVLRGMVEPPAEVTPEGLVDAARHGADYLIRVMNSAGRYVYMYRPARDRDDASYGWLRHAGTTYSLFEAYEEFGDSQYLEKGELALRYLATRLSEDAPSQGKFVLDTDDEEQQKVGGAGLALLALTKHAAVSGKRGGPEGIETMRALARFIMRQQYQDGHFRCNADLEHETGKKYKREAIYYPGEAILALMRLYAIDAQPVYLDAARRGADWIVQVRDAYVSEDNQEHDHWISYAFNELYRVTHDDAYLTHAYKIARAIQKKQRRADGAPARDYVGTFYDGQTTPASTRVEAYDADIVLSRFAGKPEAWLLASAKESARSILGQQYREADDYWLKSPAKADGGVRESLFVHDIRIDYVQHAISAWLHLARILRDPMYGTTGIPSQDPVRPASEDAAAARGARPR